MSSVRLGREADQFTFGLRSGRVVDVLQIRRFAAESWPVMIDSLAFETDVPVK